MKKLNKKILIAIMTIILFTSISINLIPKEETAAKALPSPGDTTISVDENDIKASNIVCVEHGTALPVSPTDFTIAAKYTIKPSEIKQGTTRISNVDDDLKWAQGLAYILSQTKPDYENFSSAATSPKQIALWAYLAQSPQTKRELFNIPLPNTNPSYAITIGSDSISYVRHTDNYATPEIVETQYTITSNEAYTIYQTAMDLKSGIKNMFNEDLYKGYEAVFYRLTNPAGESNKQDLILIESTTTIDPINFNFKLIKKTPSTEELLSDARFTINIYEGNVDINNEVTPFYTTYRNTEDGELTLYQMNAPSITTTAMTMVLTETIAPSGYTKMEPFKISLSLSLDPSGNKTWKIITPNGTDKIYQSSNNNLSVTLKEATDISEIEFIKQIPGGTKIPGAKFKMIIGATSGGVDEVKTIPAGATKSSIDHASGGKTFTIENLTTNDQGQVKVSGIVPSDTSKIISIYLEETYAPLGYMNISPISFSLKYKGNGYWEKTIGGTTVDISETSDNKTKVTKTVVEPANIRKLELIKISKTGDLQVGVVDDAKFEIQFQKIEKLTYNGESKTATNGVVNLTNVNTNSEGKFEITEIIPKSINETVLIQITETEAPIGRKILSKPIYLQAKYNSSGANEGLWTTDYNATMPKPTESILLANSDSSTTITVEDYSIIKDINIQKVNSKDRVTPIKNVKFEATIENVVVIGQIPENATAIVNESTHIAKITGLSTGTTGNFGLKNVRIYNIDEPITIKLTEIEASTGYHKINGEIKIILDYDKTTGKLIERSHQKDSTVELEEFDPERSVIVIDDTVNITIGNRPVIRSLEITKVNSQNDILPMPGAEFRVTIENAEKILGLDNVEYNGNKAVFNTYTNSQGKILIPEVAILDINQNIKIKLKETKSVVGYKIIEQEMEVILSYDKTTGELTKISDNILAINEFKEVNVLTNNKDKVEFKITNIPIMNLGGQVWEDNPYYILEGEKEIAYPPNGKWSNHLEKGINFDIADRLLPGIKVSLYKVNGNEVEKIEKDVYGKSLMTKTASEGELYQYTKYDEKIETLALKSGQYVFPNIELGYNYYIEFEYDGMKYIEYQEFQDRNGSRGYSKQIDQERKIITDTESDAREVERQAFNNKFAVITGGTISEDKLISTGTALSDTKIELIYNNQDKKDVNGNTISAPGGTKLRDAKIQTSTSENIKQEFIIKARISNLLSNDKNWLDTWIREGTDKGKINLNDDMLKLDCGLLKQKTDLSLMTDVYSATTTINNKKTTYSYNQLEELGNIITVGETITNDNVKYNLYLYKSDYSYRIADYLEDGSIKNNVTFIPDGIEKAKDEGQINTSQELEVYVKYAVLLNNQGMTSSKIHEIVDYYDPNYELVTEDITIDGDIVAKGPEFGRTIRGSFTKINKDLNISSFGTVALNGENYNKIKVTGMEEEMIESAEQLVIYLTFKVKKTPEGNYITLGEKSNIAEIITYSTYSTKDDGTSYENAGIIDIDSAPGNCITTDNKVYYEDDTDSARGINIKLNELTKERKLTGQVWEDKNKDGKFDTGEPLINDVTVQLIEIKDVKIGTGNYQLEYIWQEMTTGKPDVKYLNYDSKSIKYRTVNLTDGQYEFIEMVPGNYIIRYLYGDGRWYDYSTNPVTENYNSTNNDQIKKYNGYDYQSTIMSQDKYNKEYLDLSDRDKISNEALDNESRRLKVMSYSTEIDKNMGTKLSLKEDEVLKETWMCSETPKLNLSVENFTFNQDNVPGQSGNQTGYGYKVEDVKFGLAKRPETKIELEKQISGLRITGADGSIILDTFNNITKLLLPKISTRAERGTWDVQTDVELLQGATLEVQYTYTIKNNSDKDYLAKELIDKFKNSSITEYNTYLSNLSNKIKTDTIKKLYTSINKGTYLTEFYYTGILPTEEQLNSTEASSPKEVVILVPKIEEYINNELLFNVATQESSDFEKINTTLQKAKVIKATLIDLNIEVIKSELETATDTTSTKFVDFNTVVRNKEESGFLKTGKNKNYKLLLTRVVSPNTVDKVDDMVYESYLAEILSYKLPTGRRDLNSIPGNLSYRHAEDQRISLETLNEKDEFWAENIILKQSTGQDKITPIQISIIIVSSVSLIGISILLIKKYIIKKV